MRSERTRRKMGSGILRSRRSPARVPTTTPNIARSSSGQMARTSFVWMAAQTGMRAASTMSAMAVAVATGDSLETRMPSMAADAALVTDESAKDTGECAGDPRGGSFETQMFREACGAHDASENEKCTKDVAENGTAEARVKKGAGGAGDSEAEEDALVEMLANQHETKRSGDEMRNGDGGDSQFCADANGEQRSEDAADSEASDGGDWTCSQRRNGDERFKKHRSFRKIRQRRKR
jgi:hypothetical protein